MGHTRLGGSANRKWQDVIGLVGAGVDTADIAAATLDASKEGLKMRRATPRCSLFWLLTQIPLCARQSDFVGDSQRSVSPSPVNRA